MTHPVLDLPMGANDAKAATVRDYMKALLRRLLKEGEGFSGKRPFGNSGWEYELYIPLVKAGLVSGKLDADGCVDEIDVKAADALLLAAVAEL